VRRGGGILRSSLPAGLCLIVIASATLHPASRSPTRRTRAPAARMASTTVARPAAGSRKTPGPDPRTTAVTLARAYAHYLADRQPAELRPTLSPAAAAMVRQSGRLPARLNIRRVRLIGVDGACESWTARLMLVAARGRFVLSAELLLTRTTAGWQLAELVAPDPDSLIASRPPGVRPVGPAAAREAAMTFTRGYLAYTYGHPGIGQLRDLTGRLRAALAANPTRIPPTIRALHPRIASLALSPDGRGWLASANATDGQNSYQVISVIRRVDGRWRVVALRSAG